MILKNDEMAVFVLRELYQQHGYLPYKMSRFEEYDLYVQNKDFLVSDQVITFSDRSGRLLALKPDVTLSIIKNAGDQKGCVQKVYYNENVYRVDTGTHAFKEIMQTGLECIGDLTDSDVAEAVLLAAKSLAKVSDEFVLDISHMGLVAAVMDSSGLSDAGKQQAITFLRQKNSHELRRLCQLEKSDPAVCEKLCALVACNGKAELVLTTMRQLLASEKELNALNELERLCSILASQGYAESVRIDFSVGSDMKYYSGVVFKGYLPGLPAGILSGGRYDKLLRKMGRVSSAIGFAIYLDLLARQQPCVNAFDMDVVLLYDQGEDAAAVISAAEELRKEGTVLICTSLPEGTTWRLLYQLQKGEAILLENNG